MSSWTKRVDHTARVTRRLPEDVYGKGLDGKPYKLMSGCNICKQMKPLAEFYVRTDKADDDPNAVYGACIPCYDERVKNGSKKKQREAEANTLEYFLIEDDVNE